jgi:hypothetical protein
MAVTQLTRQKARIGNGGFTVVAQGTFTYDPGNLLDGAGETKSDITATGAAFGDYVLISAPYSLSGVTMNAYVQAANTLGLRLQNESGGAVDLASGTWKFLVLRMI